MKWIEEDFDSNRGKWSTNQANKENILLSFRPREGEATDVSILLDLGKVGFAEANQTWSENGGLYEWIHTTLEGYGFILVTVVAPHLPQGVFEKGHAITM